MGEVIRKKKIVNDVKIVDPKPLWIGSIMTESGGQINRIMTAEEAEKWVKEEPGRKVKMYTTAGELRQYD